MRSPIILLFYLLLGNLLAAQSQQVYDPLSATEFLPPSPNSASLGKYGGVNLGLVSGTMQHDVQLVNFTSGKLTLPISVSYSSNGLKVDEIASRVGTSWNLISGGVITRTVNGEPDEVRPRAEAPDLNNKNSRTFINSLEQLIIPNGAPRLRDSEPDVFSFNFSGGSGRFILDSNLQPILLTHSGIKIERLSNDEYAITTTDGVRYLFGGSEALESTRSLTVGYNCGRSFSTPVPTAFYLKSITHPSGNVINLSYTRVTYSYIAGINSISTKPHSGLVNKVCSGWYITVPPPQTISCVVTNYTSTPVLNEISSDNSGKIKFIYKNRKDNGDVLLDYLEVYQPRAQVWIKKVAMGYQEVKSTHTSAIDSRLRTDSSLYYRPFLTGITEFSKGSISKRQHLFYYYDLQNIAPRNSFAQDIYGYHNGATNNQNGFAPPNSLVWQKVFPEANDNRTPNGIFARTGMLSKITYPTGGTDNISYENNTVYTSVTVPPSTISETVSASGTGTVGVGTELSALFPISDTQEAVLSGGFDYNPAEGADDPLHQRGSVQLFRDGALVFTKELTSNQFFSEPINLFKGSSYQIKVTAARGVGANTSAMFTYYAGVPTVASKNNTAAGLRVSQIITDPNGGTIMTKKYVYSRLGDSQSSGFSIPPPIYEYAHNLYVPCMSGQPTSPDDPASNINCSVVSNLYYSLSASASGNVYTFNTAPVFYRAVIEESWDGSQSNGGTEHQYSLTPNTHGQSLLGEDITNAPLNDNSWTNGKEIYTHQFKRQNNVIVPIVKNYTHYTIDNRVNRNIRAYIARKKYELYCQSDPVSATELDAYDLLAYDHNQVWIYPDSIRTENFDQNGNLTGQDLELNYYDNPVHAMPTRIVSQNSDGSQLVKQTIYPSDYADQTGFIKDMQNANLLSYPVEQVSYRSYNNSIAIRSGLINTYKAGGKGISDQIFSLETPTNLSTSLKFSNRAAGILLPAGTATSFSMDPNYVSRLVFDLYDALGNPLQYTLTKGTVTSLIWDYQQSYPTAEVKNALLGDIAYTSFEAQDKGNWLYAGNVVDDGTAPGGNKCYNLSGGALIKTGLTVAKEYTVMYWAKGGVPTVSGGTISAIVPLSSLGDWTQFTCSVKGVSSLNISGDGVFIDEVRLHPIDAQMNSYTYEPLLGITSSANEKGSYQYYDYDEFQRIKNIKDFNKNIIKTYAYNYKQLGVSYKSEMRSQSFTKNDCASGQGSVIIYTVPAEKYSSTVSVAAANALADADIAAQGQSYANQNGTCSLVITYKSELRSQSFTKNDCVSGQGSTVLYTVPADKYSSAESVAAANALADAEIAAEGQNYANTNGACNSYSNDARSQSFTRNNCTTGTGSAVVYNVAAGKYTSTESLAAANALAEAEIAAEGQNYANTNGACTSYSNDARSQSFTRNNCTTGTGSAVVYNVAAGKYNSTESLAAANALADAEIAAEGQNYANANGTCSSEQVLTLTVTNQTSSVIFFAVDIDGVNASGPRSVGANSSTVVTTSVRAIQSSTVTVPITSGYVPASATLAGFWGRLYGAPSGSSFTFTGARLNENQSFSLSFL